MPDACYLHESSVEAWNMGWQCDAEVERRGLKLSDLGLIVPKPIALEMELIDIKTVEE
jgi:hypothetical protein